MDKAEIKAKAEKILKDRAECIEHGIRCLSARICPECGEGITIEGKFKGWFIFGTYYDIYKCTKCDWLWKKEIVNCPY
jgi:hypothetical protein